MGLVGGGVIYSDWDGVSGNMSRHLCWWVDLGGENGDTGSLLTGGKMVHLLGKSLQEAGFLFNGDCGNLRRGWAYSRGICTGGRLFHGHSGGSCFAKTFAERLNVPEHCGVGDVFPAFYMCPHLCFLLVVSIL